MLDTVLLWIEKNPSRWLHDCKNFLSIPSISAQPDHATDIQSAADWLHEYLRTIGFAVQIVATKKHPCLYATTPPGMCPKDAPHVLIYGHYDVQPPEPLELWTSPPFVPTVRDGKLFARGASDDKGQVHCHLAALMAWKEINAGFPCNITLLLEGEEEIGSPNLMSVVDQFAPQLRTARTLIISDTGQFAEGVPSITYGLRGLVGIEIVLHGAKTDLHSGLYGGAVANPAHALCEIIAKLHDSGGRVTVPGYYDGVLDVTPAERAMWKSLPFTEERFAAELGLPGAAALFGEAGYSAIERKWARPTLEINGLTSGYQGPGSKTVLPNRASAKITCRLVPNQDPEKLGNALVKHMESLVPAGVRMEVVYRTTGSPPAITPVDSPAMLAAADALEIGFGKKPIFQRDGGSIPVVAWFKEKLGVDSVLMGFGLPDDRIHAPDEKINLSCYYNGIKAAAALYEKLAERLSAS
jgi:acetylornithine deacetylase/succinyl-diaminopimelate desuccinylase-like protein